MDDFGFGDDEVLRGSCRGATRECYEQIQDASPILVNGLVSSEGKMHKISAAICCRPVQERRALEISQAIELLSCQAESDAGAVVDNNGVVPPKACNTVLADVSCGILLTRRETQ